MSFSVLALTRMKFRMTSLSIMALSIMVPSMSLSIVTLSTKEKNVMLRVSTLFINIPGVDIESVVMVNVVAPSYATIAYLRAP
jgi:hypothetical protein